MPSTSPVSTAGATAETGADALLDGGGGFVVLTAHVFVDTRSAARAR